MKEQSSIYKQINQTGNLMLKGVKKSENQRKKKLERTKITKTYRLEDVSFTF